MPISSRARSRPRRADHDLVLTSGGVSTGEADHVRHAVETVGRLVFWRVAIKPGRPVAMGVIPGERSGGAAFVGLPGNPVAVFVTFARVVRPLLLRLAGAEPEPLMPLPVRAAFAYRKKTGRREYVRVKLVRAADGGIEAIKHAQDGAGVHHLADRDRRAGRAAGGRDHGRAGRDRRLSLLRGACRASRVLRSAHAGGRVGDLGPASGCTLRTTHGADRDRRRQRCTATMKARMACTLRAASAQQVGVCSRQIARSRIKRSNGRGAAPQCARPRRHPRAC